MPDPLKEEFINIGVVVFDESSVCVQSLRSWDRAFDFGGHSASFAKERMDSIKNMQTQKPFTVPGRPNRKGVSILEYMRSVSKASIHSIQFTEPRGSTEELQALADFTHSAFLDW